MVAPANDNFADAVGAVLTDGEFTSAGVLNADATLEAFEGPSGTFPSMGWSCWWTWTPDADVTVAFDTIQSTGAPGVDTRLWVFTGTSTADLVLVTGDDDSGHVEPGTDYPALTAPFDAVAGTTYWVRVDAQTNDVTYVLHIGPATFDSSGTDITNYGDGRRRDGSGVDYSIYPVSPLPAGLTLTPTRVIAVQLPSPTLVNGRPT
jgi:hypothetical protein